jgi:hypothetical protein
VPTLQAVASAGLIYYASANNVFFTINQGVHKAALVPMRHFTAAINIFARIL